MQEVNAGITGDSISGYQNKKNVIIREGGIQVNKTAAAVSVVVVVVVVVVVTAIL